MYVCMYVCMYFSLLYLFGPLTAPGDYTGVSREVTFSPDTFMQTVTVSIQNDQELELPESFAVELQMVTTSPRIQLGRNNRSIVTIIDDDGGASCPSCPSCELLQKCRFGDMMPFR